MIVHKKRILLISAYMFVLFLNSSIIISTVYAQEENCPKEQRLQDDTSHKKREGRYYAFLPGFGYSPDMGLIVAGIAGVFDNGQNDDPYFDQTPYESMIIISPSWSTRGMASMLLDYDAPYFHNSLYRIRGRLWYMRNIVEQYFGIGRSTMNDLSTPDGQHFNDYMAYNDEISLITDGRTNAYYNYYLHEYVLGTLNVERDIMNGKSRTGAGFYFSKVWNRDYTNKKVKGKSSTNSSDREDAIQEETLLMHDYRLKKITGFKGGWDNSLRLSFAYDTRDFESNPRSGMFHDIYLSMSNAIMGSDFNYNITTVTTRFFYSPKFFTRNLILYSRFLSCVKSGDVPYFMMNYIPTSDKHMYGLGGEYTMRGYRLSRFVGKVMTLANFETRWIFKDFMIGDGLFELMAVPFIDIGRVDDTISRINLNGLKYAYGISLRIAYSQSFVVSFDFGFSAEEFSSFYITF